MPEPLSNQSGAEQELPQYIECLLSVSGDAAFLNTFDKAFRSGCGPQWADRPPNTKPRYSFHALFPVPEEIQRRGFLKAGRLWCAGYWEAGGDLCEMQVKRYWENGATVSSYGTRSPKICFALSPGIIQP